MTATAARAAATPSRRDRLQSALAADLGFHGAPANERSHAWHPFPAKFPPQLPRFFIEELSAPGETVLDPMCGSGTTLVEAVALGRNAIGCDIDPLARLIAATKLMSVDAAVASSVGTELLTIAERRFRNDRPGLKRSLRNRFDAKTRDFVDYWFLPHQQLELVALVETIESLPDPGSRRFFQVALSSTIIAKSGGVSRARDLAHTRPHRVPDKTPKSAFREFEQRLGRITRTADRSMPLLVQESLAPYGSRLHRAIEKPRGNPFATAAAEVRAARAESTGLDDGTVDLVVTSPPYANNAIDYMRAHKFSLVWLGMEIESLTNLRREYIGHDARSGFADDSFPKRCERSLDRLAALDERKSAVLRRYFREMTEVLREMHRVVRRGGAVIVVVGTSVLRGVNVETPECLAALAEEIGFDLIGIGVRRLDRDRRMMPARWNRTPGSRIEHRMHEERVIGLSRR